MDLLEEEISAGHALGHLGGRSDQQIDGKPKLDHITNIECSIMNMAAIEEDQKIDIRIGSRLPIRI